MRSLRVRAVLALIVATVALPVAARAQEAGLSGQVTDSTGALLPGVTVTATHTSTGNTFVAVTDAQGRFRLPLRIGGFRVQFELPGFTAVERTLELLVGQQAGVDIQLNPATVQETVTVTGEAPLIDTTSSTVAGNIDSRQMEELPINGRAWQDLTLLASGSRSNAVADAPVEVAGGNYHINVDGQQVTQLITQSGAFGNPKFSRDAIAEFQLVTNRFDATQGRSTGVQVNAVTKSGTNLFSGSLAGYFRDDKFNAADHVLKRVLPYSDQQISTTFGGPIQRDRMHFFANYEYEREPQTLIFATPYPRLNGELKSTRTEYTGGGRVDYQLSPQTRLSGRYATWNNFFPLGTGNNAEILSTTNTPAAPIETDRWMHEGLGTLTQVFGSRAVNEVKVGYSGYSWRLIPALATSTWPPGLDLPASAQGKGGPRVELRGGIVIGQRHRFSPQEFNQRTISVRNDFTISFGARGRHDLRVGGEYLHYPITQYFCDNCFGVLEANQAAIPSNIESLFPNVYNADTWNLAPLSPISIVWRQGFGNFNVETPRYVSAFWAQDDWVVNPRLTLNLGVRYDLQLNAFTNDTEILPHLPGNRPDDLNNVAPRLGAVFSLNDRTVLRGGWGLFYGDIPNTNNHYPQLYSQIIVAEVLNDGRPDFASNPWNGPTPTFEQVAANICTPQDPFRRGCIRRTIPSTSPDPSSVIPYSHQASVGVERQIGSNMSASADYVYTGNRLVRTSRNVNLAYNPATKANFPFNDVRRLPFPDWGIVTSTTNGGRSSSHALDTTFMRRFGGGWQLQANYSLFGLWDQDASLFPGLELAPDLAPIWTLGATDQRHRAVVNGIWAVRDSGFQVSGLYFFGSGQRFNTNYGFDVRQTGGGGNNRLRPDGTIVPRNAFVGEPIHRVDLRLQQRITLGRARIDGILEVFNVFNRANFGSWEVRENNVRYGQPLLNPANAYFPRTLQLGFRVGF